MFKINAHEVYHQLATEGGNCSIEKDMDFNCAKMLVIQNYESILSENILTNNKEEVESLKDSQFLKELLSSEEKTIRDLNQVTQMNSKQVFILKHSYQENFLNYLSINKKEYNVEVKLSDFIKNCISRNIFYHLYCNVFEQYEGVEQANKDFAQVRLGLSIINSISKLSLFVVDNVRANSINLNFEENAILTGMNKILNDVSQITYSLLNKNTLYRNDPEFKKLLNTVDEIYEYCEMNKFKEEKIGKINFKI